jgi:hypothetical protein
LTNSIPEDPSFQEVPQDVVEANLNVLAVMIAAELNSKQIFRLVDKLLGVAYEQERLEEEVG